MKTITTIVTYVATRKGRRNLQMLGRILAIFVTFVVLYSVLFQILSRYEGQQHSWPSAVYWVLVVMSTLGFGDITFQTDAGRVFSIVVLLSGTTFMLIVLPFTFIQFFLAPWLEAQAHARAPRSLPATTAGHVVLTNLGTIEIALVRRLERSRIPYVIVVGDMVQGLQLHDEGFRTMIGDPDDPETYRQLRIEKAALVAATGSDTANTNVAFTVRETSQYVPIVATASFHASVDILELAGCNTVLQLGEMLGQSLARRVLGRDAKSRVIGEFGELLIAEAAAADTPLVGRTLRDIRLRDHANVSVVGTWDRGKFQIGGPDTLIQSTTVLVLAGSRDQLDTYDELFCIYKSSDAPVVIIGGGRVGRAAGGALEREGIDYRIIERLPERIRDPKKYVLGNAAELEILQQAGIMKSSCVVLTTHDDDVNVYLTIYCRRLRPDIQILGRANQERNVTTLHRAGADFVLSYASTGANLIFNLLQKMDTLFLAEGLSVFRVHVPRAMVGKSIVESATRQNTGCHIIALERHGRQEINPEAGAPLPADAELILIGDADAENRFLSRYAD